MLQQVTNSEQYKDLKEKHRQEVSKRKAVEKSLEEATAELGTVKMQLEAKTKVLDTLQQEADVKQAAVQEELKRARAQTVELENMYQVLPLCFVPSKL